ncbi:hypothetical protein CSA37_10810 [Candidatus Fermentibacteria bacterium]|nr:MAG: hypothetical protein CSA37_10810 [Candidatus Fermentibacteria bacterium]
MVNHSLNFKGWETEVGKFDGGYVSTDGGALLLREVEARTGVISELADCFQDHRNPALIEHTVEELVAQRVYSLALGYEDLDDHDRLRTDPLLALAVGKTDLTGENRRSAEYRGKALVGKSTLNRLELSTEKCDRYCRTQVNTNMVREALVSSCIRITEMKKRTPKELVLDIDATDDKIHGDQEGKHFNRYYDSHCYQPLYIFCNDHPLCALLGTSSIDPARNSAEQLHHQQVEIKVAQGGDCCTGRQRIQPGLHYEMV